MNKTRAAFYICCFITIFVISPVIFGASFDCSKAKSETEKAICNDSILSILDEHMALAFSKALKSPKREYVKKEQRKWLKEVLGQCGGNKSCIKEAYYSRLYQLDYEIASGGRIVDIETEEEDLTRTLTMTCKYYDYETSQFESVSIEQTTKRQGKFAAIKKFKKGKSQRETEIFLVRPGQFAECIYPSGTRVRVKVGERIVNGFGRCGADPEVFMSLWVNERKIDSRVWFAGHCREWHEKSALSFKISNMGSGISVQKCHTSTRHEQTMKSNTSGSKALASESLSACVDFPDLPKYPKDFVEYPRPGNKVSEVGDIELLKSPDTVCKDVLEELKDDFYTFSAYSARSKRKLTRPIWSKASDSVVLPEELAGSNESIFDFDNDGKKDRVFGRIFENTYMHGSVLLVQYNYSILDKKNPFEETSGFFPCQMDKTPHKIKDCPPFSQENDEAGFSMEGQTDKDSFYFRARYSSLEPFIFQGTTYIGVKSIDENDFVGVLKPLPDRTFKEKCLFRKVPENY